MPVLGNRVRVETATSGTGTITLGSPTSDAFTSFAEAGIGDGNTVRYLIEEGNDFEIGTGVYTVSGTTLTRASVTLSKIGGTAGTSKWMSIRSRRGPDIFERYRWICPILQMQACFGSE